MATLESLDQEEDLTTSASSHLQTPNPPGKAAGKHKGGVGFVSAFKNPRKVGSFSKKDPQGGPLPVISYK